MANATITVLEADGSTQTDVVVLDVGRQAAAASKSVAAATEDKAVYDAINAILGAAADAASTSTTIKAALRAIATALGTTALDLGVGTGGSRTIRTSIDTAQLAAAVSTVQTMSATYQLVGLPSDQVWGVGVTGFTKLEDAASADGDKGVPAMVVRKATPANTSGTDGDYEFLQASAGSLWTATVATDKTLVSERVIAGGSQYETVAASQTDQALGAAGAAGDYLESLICVVATAATSQVQIKDGAGSAITILPNAVGAGIGTYILPVGLISLSGAWKVTTAAGVSVIGTGRFT